VPPPKTAIALSFDGSYNQDSTFLVGCTLDKHLFVVDGWERPEGDPEWVVPRDVVKKVVDETMERYTVVNFMCDPNGWFEEVEEWGRKYEDVITVKFPVSDTKVVAEACREFYADVVTAKRAAGLTHDGDERLARHLAQAYTRETSDGAIIVKERRDSPNKIDAAVGAVYARYGAVRAQPKKKRRVVSW
jgi:phage terminase large subunit-like protein